MNISTCPVSVIVYLAEVFFKVSVSGGPVMKRRFVRVDCASNSRPLGFRARLRRRRRRQIRDATSGQLTLRKFSVDVETFFPCFGFSVGDDDTEMGTSKQSQENVFFPFSLFLSHPFSLTLSLCFFLHSSKSICSHIFSL